MKYASALTMTVFAQAGVFDEVCAKTRKAGKILGVYTECDFEKWTRRGVQYMSVKNDTSAMLLGFETMLSRARGSNPAPRG